MPPRPSGIERNIVVSLWDFGTPVAFVHGTPVAFVHDEAAADTRDARVNANGRIYGVANSSDLLFWLDPDSNEVGQERIPTKAAMGGQSAAPSPYWGNEHIWQAAAQPRSVVIDGKARVWFAATMRGKVQTFGSAAGAGGEQPAFCKPGSSNKFAQYFPLVNPSGKQVARYDPTTGTIVQIDTCFSADHNQFAADGSLFFGQRDVIGWVDTAAYDRTGNDSASQGWGPAVLDTNGDGKITQPWTEPDEAVDLARDHRVSFGCYSVAVNQSDGSAWCAGGGSDRLVRFDRGSNPPETMKSEIFDKPSAGYDPPILGAHGVDVDSNGVIWQNWRSGYLTSFDRRKCKVLNGPTATGGHCPEGWAVYRAPHERAADAVTRFYLVFVDREGVFGLGKDIPIAPSPNTDALLALMPQTGKWVTLRVPYPLGFFARSHQGRIDDPNAGWKGRGLWSSYATYAPWHIEGGKGTKNKMVKFQLRPDPLAR